MEFRLYSNKINFHFKYETIWIIYINKVFLIKKSFREREKVWYTFITKITNKQIIYFYNRNTIPNG